MQTRVRCPAVLVGPFLQKEMFFIFFPLLSFENAGGGPFSSGKLVLETTELS